jgi:ERCC4-type nuclease
MNVEESEQNEHVRVIIDMREDALWNILEPEVGYQLEKAPLDIGDIAFFVKDTNETYKEVAILERKSAEDLGSSQRDGRYREQRARLLTKKGTGVSIGYVLEMPVWSSDLSRSWCRGVFKEVHLLNAIMRLQLRYGIPVFQVRDMEETAMWVRHIAKALVADPNVFQDGLAESSASAAAAYTDALHVKKAANRSADRGLSILLRTVQGVGPTAADAILKYVGSAGFPGFFNLSETQLATIPIGAKRKIGPAVAKSLWETFHSAPVEQEQEHHG